MEKEEISEVIKGNFCVGCGVCASKENSAYEMVTTREGRYKAKLIDNNINKIRHADGLCPFSKSSNNEDVLAKSRFSDINNIKHDNEIGYYLSSYAGHVSEGEYREHGSSGGGVSWLLKELLKNDMIDAVIHVKESKENDKLFEYSISNNLNEVRNGAKSRYYPIELSKVLQEVRNSGFQRYVIVGIPCFIKAVRNLAEKDEIIKSRIIFFIGIVCGHLKSKHFASLFAWQHRIHPQKLKNIDFRHKLPSSSAALYSVKLDYSEDNILKSKISKPASELYGTDWGLGFFKYKSCDFCDDVMAETADVVFGDAWAAEYREDWKGSNLIVTRNHLIDDLINNGIKNKNLKLDEVQKDIIIKSQSGSFRHRRKGLSFRLLRLNNLGEWSPTKRVKAGEYKVDEKYKNIQEARIWFQEKVDDFFIKALEKNNFSYFKLSLFLPIMKYRLMVYGIKGLIPNTLKDYYRTYFKNVK
ncbi:Coenzyme F420 hydrogenase/dehydrogenase, beta subunit C-terminal domain [Galbibacter mesophilus]|uniref:Coenzyme F420 hydrogenase/dehydrogenase, beta subunit C-terminal domain n=1 Tax=Galbibacter mesophilus TaxID=379069 RepID=UPI00191ECB99|nr:Coenzyme F420 hydrogenase/dehydrogenase, beta subunit C-terminal domain [Galbibacter mesophilus]MCM5663491.1 Coenzyme F420 hydrogenase/dehydrogenase, beta subunit C-terminal domain [Galbibacter mesophilus]